jgi:hypothetical protein
MALREIFIFSFHQAESVVRDIYIYIYIFFKCDPVSTANID